MRLKSLEDLLSESLKKKRQAFSDKLLLHFLALGMEQS
nr:MAG TPA: hypothetical protein [Caudoviricetes sp.]